MDTIGNIVGADLPNLKFRSIRLFYPLFCSLYHLQYGLPRLTTPRHPVKESDHPKLKMVLESDSNLLGRIEEAEDAETDIALSAEDKKFYDAYSEHWVHADKRTTMTQYLCRHFLKAVK